MKRMRLDCFILRNRPLTTFFIRPDNTLPFFSNRAEKNHGDLTRLHHHRSLTSHCTLESKESPMAVFRENCLTRQNRVMYYLQRELVGFLYCQMMFKGIVNFFSLRQVVELSRFIR